MVPDKGEQLFIVWTPVIAAAEYYLNNNNIIICFSYVTGHICHIFSASIGTENLARLLQGHNMSADINSL